MMEALLRKAVLGRHLIQFLYEGNTKVLEPHLVAYDMRGHIFLRGWFLRGNQVLDEPGWQNYMLGGMSELTVLPETFAKARLGYNPNDPNYSCIRFCL